MIKYVKGDATHPVGSGLKLIIHVCNDKGAWGAGFVMAISKRWADPERMYKLMPIKELGTIQTVSVEDDIVVANMIAQTLFGKYYRGKDIPLSYPALEKCLRKVNKIAVRYGMTVHGPRFGSGLAGGNWTTIEDMINEIITVPVTIYDYEGTSKA